MNDRGQALVEYALVGFLVFMCALTMKETLGNRITEYMSRVGVILALPSRF